jgi:hypothetical protein
MRRLNNAMEFLACWRRRRRRRRRRIHAKH